MGLWDRLRGKPPGGGAGDREALRRSSAAARDAFWAGVGAVDGDVLAPMISPSFAGGPHWPTLRQAYRVVRRSGSVIIATDGLSDAADDPAAGPVGLGLELFIETADLTPETAADTGRLGASWAFRILGKTAGDISGVPDIVARLDRLGALTTESGGVGEAPALSEALPPRFVTGDDALGVLVGGPPPDFAVEASGAPAPIRLVPVVLLTAAELEAVRAGGGPARRSVLEALAASPTGHRSSLTRESVV